MYRLPEMLRYTRQIRANNRGNKMTKKIPKYISSDDNKSLNKYFSGMIYKAIDWDKVDSLTEEQIKNHLKKLKGEDDE